MQTLDKTTTKYEQLKQRLIEINDIESAASVLYWDQATYMPPKGSYSRGRQLATLKQLAHQKFTDPTLGELLEDLKSYEKNLPYDSTEASLIRITLRDYDRAVRLPSDFVVRLSRHQTTSYHAWGKAKEENNFAAVQPYLEKMLELSQEYADFFPGYEHIADPLISRSDYGVNNPPINRGLEI
jgi:carboxypeptidase Taq